MIGADPKTLLVRLVLEPDRDLVSPVHDFLNTYVNKRFRLGVRDKVLVATNELLSNALSYASMASDVVYELLLDERNVIIEVENEVIPTRLDMLRAHLERLDADPEAAYMEELQRSLSSDALRRAHLGLARVVHEAEMDLKLEMRGSRRILLRASCRS